MAISSLPKIHDLPVRVGWGRGWSLYGVECPICGHCEHGLSLPVGGIFTLVCPGCSRTFWFAVPGMPQEMPNDGCWLTGSIDGDFPDS